MATYDLEKKIWTEQDFEQMGWHDARIYGFTMQPVDMEYGIFNLLFDIDYIFEWIHPEPPEQYFSFWVAPCTLKFETFYHLEMDIFQGISDFLSIQDINLLGVEDGRYYWEIELFEGAISLKSFGFKQIVRKEPVFMRRQSFTLEERGGVSFSEVAA